MNQKAVFILLFLFATMTLVGCYTKLGYYDPAYLKEKQHKHVEKTDKEMEHVSDSNGETDPDESEGYYGRRKPGYGSSYPYAGDSYWVPYASYPYAYYPPVHYYPYSWSYPWHYGYGYHVPYYGYYRSYYPYSGYYGRYHGRTFYPASRRTYGRGAVSKRHQSEHRRSRYSRSVTSFNPQSDRPQRRTRNRNEN